MNVLTKYIPALVLLGFGMLTLYLTSSILLDLFGMREKQANYVLFVIWVNFFCGFIYVFASYGFIKSKKWVIKILGIALLVLLITFIAFIFYVSNGGIHKADTFGALIFRMSLTTLFLIIAYFTINKTKKDLLKI